MTFDATRACELLVGLDDMTVLAVDEHGEGLTVLVESTPRVVGCDGCGTRATVKDRPEVSFGDLACFGRPVTLVWRKVRWRCPEGACPVGSWTETNPKVAAPRCGLTRRAGLWACRQVGYYNRAVSAVAEELACSWSAVMSAVSVYGTPLVEDPARAEGVEMLGVDETSFLKATPNAATRWVSAAVDVGRRRVIDLFEGRNAADLDAWLEDRPEAWKAAVSGDRRRPARAVPGRVRPASRPRHPGRGSLPRRGGRHPRRRRRPPPGAERDVGPSGPQTRPAVPGPQAADPRRGTSRPRRRGPPAGPAARWGSRPGALRHVDREGVPPRPLHPRRRPGPRRHLARPPHRRPRRQRRRRTAAAWPARCAAGGPRSSPGTPPAPPTAPPKP